MDGFVKSRLQEVLGELKRSSDEVIDAAVVGDDGCVLSSSVVDPAVEARLGAISAAILSLGERAASESLRGELAQVFIEGTEGYIFVVTAGRGRLLTVIVRKCNSLGGVLGDIRDAVKRIMEISGSRLHAEHE